MRNQKSSERINGGRDCKSAHSILRPGRRPKALATKSNSQQLAIVTFVVRAHGTLCSSGVFVSVGKSSSTTKYGSTNSNYPPQSVGPYFKSNAHAFQLRSVIVMLTSDWSRRAI